MGKGKGIPKKFVCTICKISILNERKFMKHIAMHFNDEKCPLCGMKTRRISEHLIYYHIRPNKSRLLHKDLAILVKESGNSNFLYEPELGLSEGEIKFIKRLAKRF
jgi:hypothetical protein